MFMCTLNHLDRTRRALEILRRCTPWSDDVRLTVIDTGSQDGTQEYLLREGWFDVILLRRNPGLVRVNNMALRLWPARYYVNVHNDLEVCPGWLETLIRAAESDPRIGLIGPNPCGDPRAQIYHVNPDGGISGKVVDVPPSRIVDAEYVENHGLLIKDQLLNAIGPWDEDFNPFWYDDTELSFRARRDGWRTCLYCGLPIHHTPMTTARDIPGLGEIQARNRDLFIKKCGDMLK